MFGKIDLLDLNTLIEKCLDFYPSNFITESRDLIYGDANKILEPKEKKTKKISGSKTNLKGDLEDIINVIKILKDKCLLDKIPTYVAANFNYPDDSIANTITSNISGASITKDNENNLEILNNKIDQLAITVDLMAKRFEVANVVKPTSSLWSDAVRSPSRTFVQVNNKNKRARMETDETVRPNNNHKATNSEAIRGCGNSTETKLRANKKFVEKVVFVLVIWKNALEITSSTI